MDIAARRETSVLAVASGRITKIIDSGYGSIISVADLAGGKGWNYKHVEPTNGLSVGKPIQEGVIIGKVATSPNALIPDHLHLDRGTAHDNYPGFAAQFAPNLNPILEFDLVGLDTTKPTVDEIKLRLAADDVFTGQRIPFAGNRYGGDETPRRTSHYFTDAVKISGADYTRLGRYATAIAANKTKSEPAVANGNIDIIASAYDIFGGGPHKLGVYGLEFIITGNKFAATSGNVTAYDFSALHDIRSYLDFINPQITRSVYENDSVSDSKIITGPYFYTATNTPNKAFADVKGSKLVDDKKFYWNSDVATGLDWNDPQDTSSNANAGFPDDTYEITVTALDQSGNAGSKTVKVLLDNWVQTVALSAKSYKANQPIELADGTSKGYRSGQKVNVFVIPKQRNDKKPANGTALPANAGTSVTSDQDGKLPKAKISDGEVAGSYWAITDYNGDGEYTEGLDGAQLVIVNDGVLEATLDGSTEALDLGFTVNFFGTDYSQLYVNNNGNVTFTRPYSAYNPPQLESFGLPVLAPFWADADTRTEGSQLVTFEWGERDGHATFTVNWFDIGRYNLLSDKLNRFQLVIVDQSDVGEGVFDAEFVYTQIHWESSDGPSGNGGTNGLGGRSARVGYTGGKPGQAFELEGSGVNGTFLDESLSGLIHHSLNSETLGVYVFRFGVNHPPIAVDDRIKGDVGTPLLIPVLVNDSDPDGDTLEVESVTEASDGTVNNFGDSVLYTPNSDFIGTDTFTYTVRDPRGMTATATVTVTVRAPNRAPVAVDDVAYAYTFIYLSSGPDDHGSPPPTTPVTIPVLANDSDPDGDDLAIIAVTQAEHGTVTIVGSQIVYLPDDAFAGLDSFTYTVSDGRGGTATATVQVAVMSLAIRGGGPDPDPSDPPIDPPTPTEPTPTEAVQPSDPATTFDNSVSFAQSSSFGFYVDGRIKRDELAIQ